MVPGCKLPLIKHEDEIGQSTDQLIVNKKGKIVLRTIQQAVEGVEKCRGALIDLWERMRDLLTEALGCHG